jgi:DNA polymerase (family 10)
MSKNPNRIPFDDALIIANKVISFVESNSKTSNCKLYLCGSLRRKSKDCGDVDFCVLDSDWEVLEPVFRECDFFEDKQILVKDGTFKSGALDGLNIEFYVGPKDGMGALMQFTTGSAAHNVEVRRKAIKLGYKVNQYGVWDRKTNQFIGGKTEEEFYKVLGLDYLSPEERSKNWSQI